MMERREFLATALIPVSFSVPSVFKKPEVLPKKETQQLVLGRPGLFRPGVELKHLEAFKQHLARQEKAKRALKELADFTETEANKCRKAICKRLPEETRDYRDEFVSQQEALGVKHGWSGLPAIYVKTTTIWCAIELTFRTTMDGFSFFGIDLDEEIEKRKELIDWFAENDPSVLSYARLRNRYSSQTSKLGVINEMQTSPMD
jgi:hypothetical protein